MSACVPSAALLTSISRKRRVDSCVCSAFSTADVLRTSATFMRRAASTTSVWRGTTRPSLPCTPCAHWNNCCARGWLTNEYTGVFGFSFAFSVVVFAFGDPRSPVLIEIATPIAITSTAPTAKPTYAFVWSGFTRLPTVFIGKNTRWQSTHSNFWSSRSGGRRNNAPHCGQLASTLPSSGGAEEREVRRDTEVLAEGSWRGSAAP